ncbi:hypothetical protein SEVIR_7G271600v4 [Setaria viridis]|uniref:Uncharacterized protein n=1 Tax=Setaria viridis TaxID=4556 RepID=A0A4U6TYM6_SETVI|nr:uncharacterized protein LOC117863312 [Setaria viridis]TKW06905.1 hypothetical protein SEVIR_7G271600v2 [Setaria viridis]
MAPASSSPAGVACFVVLLVLAGASVSHGSFQGRSVLSDEQGRGILALWRRSLADAATPANNSLVLAAARTHRSDPFANLTAYTGGWNISDQHYWGSVAYTAVPLFVITVLWFIGFGAVLLIISCCCCFCRNKDNAYSPCCYFTSLALLIILTLATISGCVLLHCGSDLFHHSTIKTVDYVVGQGNLTANNLRNFAGSLAAAKSITIDQIFLPADVQQKIDVVEEKLNSSANEFSTRMLENSRKIKNVVNHMEHELMATAAVMGGLALLGFLFSILGLRFFVSIMVILAWFNLTVTLMSSGVFLLLHNVVGDTCVAMDEWVTHPQAHTALDDILPCVDVATANLSLYRSQEVTAQLVALVNNVVVNISNRDFPPGLKPLYFNQSGPLMPVLCNPFNPDMSPRACAPGEVDFESAAREWKRFECATAGPPGSEVCATPGRVTPAAYGQMTAAASVSRGLYEYGPFLVQLQDCSFVRETFTAISDNNCPGLERYSRHVYVGLIIISGAVMLSVVFWMVHTRQRRRRAMSKQL